MGVKTSTLESRPYSRDISLAISWTEKHSSFYDTSSVKLQPCPGSTTGSPASLSWFSLKLLTGIGLTPARVSAGMFPNTVQALGAQKKVL